MRYLPRYRLQEENSVSDSILFWVVLTGSNIQPLHIVRNLFIIIIKNNRLANNKTIQYIGQDVDPLVVASITGRNIRYKYVITHLFN